MAQNSNSIAVLTSEARTATTTSGTFINKFNRGVHVVVDVTASADTPSVTFAIQAKYGLSGEWVTLLVSAAVTGASTNIYKILPGGTIAANLVAADQLPRVWRVLATHADTDSITYSVEAQLLV